LDFRNPGFPKEQADNQQSGIGTYSLYVK
jgi:hypothetical protein